MAKFAEQQVLCCIALIAVSRVDDGEQHRMAAIVRMVQRTSGQEHRSPTKVGKIVLDFVVDHGGGLGDHISEQTSQLGNVPLTIAQLVDALPDRLVTINFERLKEGTAGILDAKAFIQHKQGICNRIDYALRLNVTDAQKAVKVFRIHDKNVPG